MHQHMNNSRCFTNYTMAFLASHLLSAISTPADHWIPRDPGPPDWHLLTNYRRDSLSPCLISISSIISSLRATALWNCTRSRYCLNSLSSRLTSTLPVVLFYPLILSSNFHILSNTNGSITRLKNITACTSLSVPKLLKDGHQCLYFLFYPVYPILHRSFSSLVCYLP